MANHSDACSDFRRAAHLSRRQLLTLGGLYGTGLLLPDLLRGQARGSPTPRGRFGRAKSVIVLYLHGGHAQQETWDPKPDASQPARGEFGAIATSVPGVRIGELLPHSARMMHKLAVIRSLSHPNANHVQASLPALTGHSHPPAEEAKGDFPPAPTDFPSFGAVLDSLRPARKLPTWVQVGPLMRRANGTVLHGQSPGFLGNRHGPLVIDQDLRPAGVRVEAVAPAPELSMSRLDARRDFLRAIDGRRRLLDQVAEVQTFDAYQQRALGLLTSSATARAFDLAAEPDAVRESYGRTEFGQRCLLARRLAEAGVPMVNVHFCRTPTGSWDTHGKHFSHLMVNFTLYTKSVSHRSPRHMKSKKEKASGAKSIGISYTRFSDPKQAKGSSQRRQVRDYRRFCRTHNLIPSAEAFADKGRSGYTDEHRKKGRFGQLLAMAKDGKFVAGTVVVVEAWDRLGRLRPDKQTELIAELLRTGLRIGVCRLGRIFSEDDFGTAEWTTLAVFIQLAYQESKQKAERIAASWQFRRRKERKARAAGQTRLVTGRIPAWLAMLTGKGEKTSKGRKARKLVPIPERVAVVRRIFALAADGYGKHRIVRTLTAEGGECFSRSGAWTCPYVDRILNDRRVLGEYQPRRIDGTPDGAAIAAYYPAVVTEAEYMMARRGQAERLIPRGRKGRPKDSRYVNLFQSMLHHARDGGGFCLHNLGTGERPRLVLASLEGKEGRAERMFTFPYAAFETGFLRHLSEIDPKDVMPRDAAAQPSRIDALKAKLQAAREQIASLRAELKAGFSKTLAALLREAESEEEQSLTRLSEEQAKTAKPLEKAWKQVPKLVELVAREGATARLRLRTELRQIIDGIWVMTARRGRTTVCYAQAVFAGGESHRSYLLLYRSGRHADAACWCCLAAKYPDALEGGLPEDDDLRTEDGAAWTKDFLENYPTDLIGKLLSKHGEAMPD